MRAGVPGPGAGRKRRAALGRIIDALTELVTVHPIATLASLFVVTVFFAAGIVQLAPRSADEAFLPQDSEIIKVLEDLETLFSDSASVTLVTLLFRGEAFTPQGLAQMDRVIERVIADPDVADNLAPKGAVLSPSRLVAATLRVTSFDGVGQAQIDGAMNAISSTPELAQVRSAIGGLTGTDVGGTPIAVANIRLIDTDSENQAGDAELRIHELVKQERGPLSVRSLSQAVFVEELDEASGPRAMRLLGLALVVIAAITLLFMRTVSDLLLTLGGLALALVWTTGAQGWLGPNALGLIGPPSLLSSIVPVIVIGLAVDYSIQTVALYREQTNLGVPGRMAVRIGLRTAILPLSLAAITTMLSFFTTLLSPFPAVADFGLVTGMGVGMSLIAMLTLIPAVRSIIDKRREDRGNFAPARPISEALPGIRRASEALGRELTRRPGPYLLLVVLVTIGLGYAATRIDTAFSRQDLLSRDSEVIEDLKTLESALGGSTEVVNVLINAELTDTRTVLNLWDFITAFQDEAQRPAGVESNISLSFGQVAFDWITDDGRPEDKYDPELAMLFQEATAGLHLDTTLVQEFINRLESKEPEVVPQVLVNNPEGIDTMLLQFQALTGDPGRTVDMAEETEKLWRGHRREITPTSQSIIGIEVSNAVTESQREAIVTTVAAALVILVLFFWATVRQPALGFIAVGPIILSLICALGTMALLGIPYTPVTSIITALSIGIGVDYTIHMIHRYREEFTKVRNPETAAIQTLATTGAALLGSALTTAFGFGALVISPVPSFQQFGLTVAITISYSLIVSIVVVLPAMTVWGAYQNKRLRSMVERLWNELDVAIDDIHQRHEQDQGTS